MKQARSQGGLGDLSPEFHPKILQFARVFEKKPENPPPQIFPYKKFQNPPSNNFWLCR